MQAGCTVTTLGKSELHLEQLPLNKFALVHAPTKWCFFLLSRECISTPPLITLMLLARGTHLDGREGGDDGGRSEAVRDEAEVGEVPLNRGVEYLRGPRVAQRRAVLVQQVHELLHDDPARAREGEERKIMPSICLLNCPFIWPPLSRAQRPRKPTTRSHR